MNCYGKWKEKVGYVLMKGGRIDWGYFFLLYIYIVLLIFKDWEKGCCCVKPSMSTG